MRSTKYSLSWGWLQKLVIVTFSFAVGLLLVEIALWAIAPIKYHEWMLWIADGHIKGRAAPNQKFSTAEGHEVRINSLGFRGPEYGWHPPKGTLRLAAFGGSSTFCYEARGEKNTWPSRLERQLSDALKMPVEVINLGLPGFDAKNSKINYLYFGRALNPHVVLQYDTWNDMKAFRQLAHRPIIFADVASNKPVWQNVARATQIGRRVRNFLYKMNAVKMENFYTSLEEQGVVANLPVAPAALEWNRQHYRDFATFAKSDGVLPVMISQATILSSNNLARKEYRLEMSGDLVGMTIPILYQTWMELNRIVESVAKEKDAIFIDGYNAVPHDFKHLYDVVHLTDEGSTVLANTIAQSLLRNAQFLTVVERVRHANN